jgi:hypothetical protein
MKSLFHSKASSAAELQAELVEWLSARAEAAQTDAEHNARTKARQAALMVEARVYREAAEFWRALLLDGDDADAVVAGNGNGATSAARIGNP